MFTFISRTWNTAWSIQKALSEHSFNQKVILFSHVSSAFSSINGLMTILIIIVQRERRLNIYQCLLPPLCYSISINSFNQKTRCLLKIQIPGPHPRITELEFLKAGPRNLFLIGTSCISDVKSAFGITGLAVQRKRKFI